MIAWLAVLILVVTGHLGWALVIAFLAILLE
jgi:hypothetical protein